MKQRTRRTPEQLAAYHQAKANQARAKAAKAAKDAALREQIQKGKAVGSYSPEDVPALLALGELMVRGFGSNGSVHSGEDRHWQALEKLFKPEGEKRRTIVEWWIDNKHPLG
jgi:hypothetical protein